LGSLPGHDEHKGEAAESSLSFGASDASRWSMVEFQVLKKL